MKITVWSDFACPFCYASKRKLEAALAQLGMKDSVEIVYRSYELYPDAEKGTTPGYYDTMVQKRGMSLAMAESNAMSLTEMAKEAGLEYHFEYVIPTNTHDAHRLAYFAKIHGKMSEMMERLMRAHFSEPHNIGDHETLVMLAEEVGLDGQEVRTLLAGDEFTKEVKQDESEADQRGLEYIPYYVFDDKITRSGALSVQEFVDAISKATG